MSTLPPQSICTTEGGPKSNPRATLATLPSELRNTIFELVLVSEESLSIHPLYWRMIENESKPLALLATNRAIHHEASSIFYAQNCFDFTMGDAEQKMSFLANIGHRNASFIRKIQINFPYVENCELNKIAIHKDDSDFLKSIAKHLLNVKTVTFSLQSATIMEPKLDIFDNSEVVDEAMQLLDTAFKSLPSGPRIVVEAYVDGPNMYIRNSMVSHGWVIDEKERVYENWSDGSGGGFDSDYHRDYYSCDSDEGRDYGGDDDYDYEYDSDFWRRAGD